FRSWSRAMDHSTAGELGRPDGTLASPAGALLAVRLGATAGHFTAALGLVRALSCCRELCHHNLVDQRHIDLHVEDLCGQLDLAGLGAHGVEYVDGGHVTPPSRRS